MLPMPGRSNNLAALSVLERELPEKVFLQILVLVLQGQVSQDSHHSG